MLKSVRIPDHQKDAVLHFAATQASATVIAEIAGIKAHVAQESEADKAVLESHSEFLAASCRHMEEIAGQHAENSRLVASSIRDLKAFLQDEAVKSSNYAVSHRDRLTADILALGKRLYWTIGISAALTIAVTILERYR